MASSLLTASRRATEMLQVLFRRASTPSLPHASRKTSWMSIDLFVNK